MSTTLKSTQAFTMTQFAGGKDVGLCLQLTARGPNFRYVQMNKAEALELADALYQWVTDDRPEDHT